MSLGSNGTDIDLNVAALDGSSKWEMKEPLGQYNGDLSPEGKWLVYESNESGRTEVNVRPFPNVDDGS